MARGGVDFKLPRLGIHLNATSVTNSFSWARCTCISGDTFYRPPSNVSLEPVSQRIPPFYHPMLVCSSCLFVFAATPLLVPPLRSQRFFVTDTGRFFFRCSCFPLAAVCDAVLKANELWLEWRLLASFFSRESAACVLLEPFEINCQRCNSSCLLWFVGKRKNNCVYFRFYSYILADFVFESFFALNRRLLEDARFFGGAFDFEFTFYLDLHHEDQTCLISILHSHFFLTLTAAEII